MENANTEKLKLVLDKYGVPDPKIVGKLPKGGTQLDYVSHSEITKILLDVDPHWRWVPIAWDNGRPAIHVENGMATMWGELTLLGQARLGVGSVRADKPELDKELVGDFLRNAAMRFGIALSLWSKQEWDDLGEHPASASPRKQQLAPAPTPAVRQGQEIDAPLSPDDVAKFNNAVVNAGLFPEDVLDKAGLENGKLKQSDLPKLRKAFKELQQQKP